ncbi:hypothetical protein EIN_074280 [Entamoeba invadens IP1]|uniref:TLDc domain-containing protein n=1 Tax=Entamoeba invadens IP1 TaxID=370355 RepID=A0A0A1UBI0_ENTIV|nr:hypothetical protein EIN_074280 [Entamoeba invadens IP1]ELP92585.1 hypothetical protein EIN_074280 [Entamoeba invadens IP1]|eukprot:XP_004259356.1 hypothetical protein EIN_074280 [Entamoeba invadens IP1]
MQRSITGLKRTTDGSSSSQDEESSCSMKNEEVPPPKQNILCKPEKCLLNDSYTVLSDERMSDLKRWTGTENHVIVVLWEKTKENIDVASTANLVNNLRGRASIALVTWDNYKTCVGCYIKTPIIDFGEWKPDMESFMFQLGDNMASSKKIETHPRENLKEVVVGGDVLFGFRGQNMFGAKYKLVCTQSSVMINPCCKYTTNCSVNGFAVIELF